MTTDREMISESLPGGATRVQVLSGSPAQQRTVTPGPSAEDTSKRSMSIQMGLGGSIIKGKHAEFSTSNLHADKGPILRTATTKTGSISTNITEGSIVKVGSMQMTVKQAIDLGALERDGQGGFREVGQNQAPFAGSGAAAQAPEAQPVEVNLSVSPAATEAASWLCQNFGGSAVESRLYQIGGAMMDGDDSKCHAIIEQMSRERGLEPGIVAQKYVDIFESYDQAAERYFQTKGEDAERILNWGEKYLGDGMKSIFFRFMQGDTTGFDAVIREYHRSLVGKEVIRY